MPSIKDQNVVDAIAKAYCHNGYVKSRALQAGGYSVNYSERVGLELFSNVQLKAAIVKEKAKQRAKIEVTEQYLIDKFIKAMEELPIGHVNSIRAAENLGKHIDFFKADNKSRIDKPLDLTEAERAELKRMAKAATAIKLRRSG